MFLAPTSQNPRLTTEDTEVFRTKKLVLFTLEDSRKILSMNECCHLPINLDTTEMLGNNFM